MMIARQAFLSSLILAYLVIASAPCSAQLFGKGAKAKPRNTTGGTPQMHHDSAVKQATWPGIPMPKVTMPDMSPVTAPFKSGYNKVAAGTKSVWDGTKEMFSFGKGSNVQHAQKSRQQPSFWKRLTSPEPAKPDGPQTVGEWMSQPRLDP